MLRRLREALAALNGHLNDGLEALTGRRLAKRYRPSFFEHLLAVRSAFNGPATFEQFALTNLHRSSAQFLQDLWVLHELGELKGYFVEFGALDGREMSNTWLLESCYGWQGILAEPNPIWHDSLRENRPGSVVDTRCVYTNTGREVEFWATEVTGLATIVGYGARDMHAEARKKHEKISVPTVSLYDLLSEHKAPEVIDYLSIDTEGSELDILSAYDFSRQIRCISVEHQYSTDYRAWLDSLLRAQGFVERYPEASFYDAWYVHRSVLAH